MPAEPEKFADPKTGGDSDHVQGFQALPSGFLQETANLFRVQGLNLFEVRPGRRPGGRADPERGIRQFVVGTGAEGTYPIRDPIANSEVHDDLTYGVLKLTLRSGGYEWRFVLAEGGTFTDSGSARCH